MYNHVHHCSFFFFFFLNLWQTLQNYKSTLAHSLSAPRSGFRIFLKTVSTVINRLDSSSKPGGRLCDIVVIATVYESTKTLSTVKI